MEKKVMLALFFAALFLINFNQASAAEVPNTETRDQAAVTASQTALTAIDKAQYAEAWDAGSVYLKTMAQKDKFITQLSAARKVFGGLVSRNLSTRQFTTKLPGAPDGEYYVLGYYTFFENKKSAFETVTVMKDNDSQWRLAGYYIKQ